jgi:transcriptional regulator GlxA family with amidase domain
MSELAVNVGFMTAENFIKIFKEKFGLSPLEYRLKHRK